MKRRQENPLAHQLLTSVYHVRWLHDREREPGSMEGAFGGAADA